MCRGLRSSERFGFFTSCIRTPEDHIARLALVRATPRRRCSRSLARARAQFLPLTPPPHAPSTLLIRRWSHRTGIRFPPALLPVSKLNHTMLCTTGADVSASWCLGPACRGSPYQLFSPVRREQSSRLTPRAPATYAKLDHQVQRRHRGKHRHG
jgi:hypothetical protein